MPCARTAAYAVRQLFTQKDREKRSGWGWAAGAAVLCMGLFIGASRLLLAADEGFRALLAPMEDWLRFDWAPVVWLRLALRVPVGAWMVGLHGG